VTQQTTILFRLGGFYRCLPKFILKSICPALPIHEQEKAQQSWPGKMDFRSGLFQPFPYLAP